MELRLYAFVNFYLSSIQQGIQTGHLSVDMVMKYGSMGYADHQAPRQMCEDWARNHKTYITLNGGANEDINTTYMRLGEIGVQLGLPFGFFKEDEKSLGGIMTCCGIVVPAKYFEAMNYRSYINKFPEQKFNKALSQEAYYYVNEDNKCIGYLPETTEWNLIDLIKSCGLAR